MNPSAVPSRPASPLFPLNFCISLLYIATRYISLYMLLKLAKNRYLFIIFTIFYGGIIRVYRQCLTLLRWHLLFPHLCGG